MVQCLHQNKIYMKRKLRVWRPQKCIPIVGTKTPLTCTGCQTTPYQGMRYRAGNGNLRQLGWTYGHGPMFAPRQYLYQKEAMGMERPECIALVGSKTPPTCVICQTTRFQGGQYRAENGNLRKLWWTFRHGTVFPPRQVLYEKEVTGMERPEMHSPSRCKNSS